jgi:dienelactone hydrolase
MPWIHALLSVLLLPALVLAGEPALACSREAGPHVETAQFAAWFPPKAPAIRAVLALLPGHNGDGRPLIDDPEWRTFAEQQDLGLLGVRFVSLAKPEDKRHAYSSASLGSGQALLDALVELAKRGKRPEAAQAPLLLWGFSAGGQFNYEFACWRPERVVAFVANKGGYYSTHLAPRAAQLVPGLLCVGLSDAEWRVQSLTGIYACNRQAGAMWTYAPETGVGHDFGGSRELARRFFASVLPLRLPPKGPGLKAVDPAAGLVGYPADGKTWPAADAPPHRLLTWLPDAGFAEAWSAFVRNKPAAR